MDWQPADKGAACAYTPAAVLRWYWDILE